MRHRMFALFAFGLALAGAASGAAGQEYHVKVTGWCPGRIMVEWTGGTPGRQQAFVYSRERGSVVIPSGPCAGTILGLGEDQLQLYAIRDNRGGNGAVLLNAGAGACGGYLQLVEGGTCRTSNVSTMP